MAAIREATFTEAVRQELARHEPESDDLARIELAAIVRLGGTLTLSGGDGLLTLDILTSSGAVARRAFTLLQRCFDIRPSLFVRAPGGMHRRSTYGVHVEASAARYIAQQLGVLDARGMPFDGLQATDFDRDRAVAYLRGAVLAGASISTPGRAPHLEILVGTAEVARELAELIRTTLGGTATASLHPRPRVVMKSGRRIGELLTVMGATGAFLTWDDRRLRRQLREDANRLANADAANLRRTIEAAGAQVDAVERVVAAVGWDGVDEELRAVALARIANPSATLGELGELVGLGRSAVHRRLQRLARLAKDVRDDGPGTSTSV